LCHKLLNKTAMEKKQIYVREIDEPIEDYIPIDEMVAKLLKHKAEGKTHFYVTAHSDSCGGGIDGYELEFIEQREETDEEYNTRLEKKRLEDEKEAREKQLRADKLKAKRLEDFLKLKEEFEPKEK
jgi:hypothetical protein